MLLVKYVNKLETEQASPPPKYSKWIQKFIPIKSFMNRYQNDNPNNFI